jgi:hypothetical protein
MPRYIDGEKLLEYYEERHKNLCLKNGETDAYCQGYEDAMYAAEHLDFAADVVPRAELEHTLSDLKKEIHDKAVYPHLSGVEPYISLKVFDAVINKLIGS